MKQRFRIFAASFIITLVLVTLVGGLLVVDQSTTRYGFGNFKPIFDLEQSAPRTLDIVFFGTDYDLNLGMSQQAQNIIKQFPVLLPRGVRLGAQLYLFLRNELEKSSWQNGTE